jgi:glycosyltransferase involved in cell wall biosynthesis
MPGLPLSVIILTYNEEINIGRCLDSVFWCDDVVVLDSHSLDNTVFIAQKKGARIIQRKFDNYANQRNFALRNIEYKHDWALMLDADEIVPDDLAKELVATLASCKDSVTLLRLRRKDFFMGKWLKHSTNYSSLWIGRVVRLGHVRVERSINEEYHTSGETINLNACLIHYPFSKGLMAWIEKHNRYSTMEAVLVGEKRAKSVQWRHLLSSDPIIRRKSAKTLIYKMPFSAGLMFIGRYIISGGFLDGRAGLRFCILKTFYEYMIGCKCLELKRRTRGLAI